jgi:murein DD-endopeptidase MepM/ murein hydrolase activator NlpD
VPLALTVALLALTVAPSLGVVPVSAPAPPSSSIGSYAWPVSGPVLRPFEQPSSPYGAGHRGIDIGASAGTQVRAAAAGTVAFAGRVADGSFVSVEHPDGIRTTYSFLSKVGVRAGERVLRGTVLGASGDGHTGSGQPHLHFGARFAGEYIDPMLLLERGSMVGLVRLAPLEDRGAGPAPGGPYNGRPCSAPSSSSSCSPLA